MEARPPVFVALVVELVDTLDLGSSAEMRVGSSPIWRTKQEASGPLFCVASGVQEAGSIPLLFPKSDLW